MDPVALRNRLVIATNLWRDHVREPLPKMPAGDPETQIEGFELELVERLCSSASAENARDIASMTWDLVHDRRDTDPVKQRVTEWHAQLATLDTGRLSGLGKGQPDS